MVSTLRFEFAKYFVAGLLAFLSDFVLYLALTKGVGIHYLIANIAGFCVGLTVSYVFCIRWVFAHRTYGVARIELPVFLGVSLVMLLVGEVILLGLVEYLSLGTAVAKIVMTGMIFVCNFSLKKLLLFRRKIY